jgi:DNA polymerase elongation subunit (family B)
MKILMIDIETAPNLVHTWGLYNQNIGINQIIKASYMLCFAAKWFNEKETIFKSIYHDGKTNMLNSLHSLLCEADAVVHFNGKKFDVPYCNKEFILNGMPPTTKFHQIDLLPVARTQFRFTSNKLDFLAQSLGLGHKTKHTGHDLWKGCMENDAISWKTMMEYNINDIIILEEVYKVFLPWIKNHPNHGLYTDSNRPVCPNCGSTHLIKKGVEKTTSGEYQRYRCISCQLPIRGKTNYLDPVKKENMLIQSR